MQAGDVPSDRVSAEELEARWRDWRRDRNRRSAWIAGWLTLALNTVFLLLDRLLAPPEGLALLVSTRAAIYLCCVFLLAKQRSEWFGRWDAQITAVFIALIGFSISVMTAVLGGFGSSYYAGINLVILAAGLLFMWPPRVAATTHLVAVIGYAAVNLPSFRLGDVEAMTTNLFFLCSTALIVTIGQWVQHRSARSQLEAQLTIERTKDKLQEAHAQLQELDAFKSKFFANITHELKTPLAMILSPLELLLQGDLGPTTEPQKATIRSMMRSGMKLLKLINDLLDLSKLEQARVQLRIAERDLVSYLDGLVRQAEVLARRKGITLRFEPAVQRTLVWCDLERLERVFVNLLSNALKFTPPGGNVWVRVVDLGDSVDVKVQDDGPGFAEEEAERLFERFYQADMGGTRKHGGTGIGLALARELVELHGGRIEAQGTVGKGATFTVTLLKDRGHFREDVLVPGHHAEPSEPLRFGGRDILANTVELDARQDYRLLDIAEATDRRVVERDPDEHQRRWTVLIVEDTPDVIRVVHLALRQQFKVMAAPDGIKGLEMALRERPSLIITDLMMPGIDGLELTRRLRADPITRHTPIIMLTARGAVEDRVAGLDTGVNAYLQKPFSPRELLATARGLLDIQETQADLLLTQRMDSLEAIAGGLAHEINNPLNYIRNSIKRLQLDVGEAMQLVRKAQGGELAAQDADKLAKLEARVVRMADTAEAGVQRIGQTVDLMGRYSREGYSRLPREHDVFGAIRDVVSVVLPATGRQVEVLTEFHGDGSLRCVPEEFNQAVGNLIQNAIEAVADEGGRVQIRADGQGTTLLLTVSDNGPGIPEEVRQRIFTPFFTTKGAGRGMGMGLTITRRVVQSLGGNIQIEGSPGEGTVFVVSLPRLGA